METPLETVVDSVKALFVVGEAGEDVLDGGGKALDRFAGVNEEHNTPTENCAGHDYVAEVDCAIEGHD